jgi:hypothetical protein
VEAAFDVELCALTRDGSRRPLTILPFCDIFCVSLVNIEADPHFACQKKRSRSLIFTST